MTERLTVLGMTQRSSPASPEYVTYHEAADILRVSPRTLLRYVAAGHLSPSRLPTGQPRLRRSDVESLLTPSDAA